MKSIKFLPTTTTLLLYCYILIQQIPNISAVIPHELLDFHPERHDIFRGYPNPYFTDELYWIDTKIYYTCKHGGWYGDTMYEIFDYKKPGTIPNITRYVMNEQDYDSAIASTLNIGDFERIKYFYKYIPTYTTAPGIHTWWQMIIHVIFLLLPWPLIRLHVWMTRDLKYYIWKSLWDFYTPDYTRGTRFSRAGYNKFYLWDNRTDRIVGGHGWVDYVDEKRAVKYGIRNVQLNPDRILPPWILDACKIEVEWLKVVEKEKAKKNKKKNKKKKKKRKKRRRRRSEFLIHQ